MTERTICDVTDLKPEHRPNLYTEREVSVPWCLTCDEPITTTWSEHVVSEGCDVRDGVVWKVVDDAD